MYSMSATNTFLKTKNDIYKLHFIIFLEICQVSDLPASKF